MTNIEILLVEDNIGDIDLVKLAIANGKILANLHIVSFSRNKKEVAWAPSGRCTKVYHYDS